MKKIVLTSMVVIGLLSSGCGSDDESNSAAESLEKDSIKITELANHIIEYSYNNSTSSYKYCPNNKVYYGSDLKEEGIYNINENNVSIIKNTNISYVTNGSFEKDKSYKTETDSHEEKVLKITETICGDLK